jgi:hypothetical protein
MGLALAFSFVLPLSFYACLLLAILSALIVLVMKIRRRPAVSWFASRHNASGVRSNRRKPGSETSGFSYPARFRREIKGTALG